MIPKTIHYIWLSDNPLDKTAQSCLRSWKRCAPDYRIKRWSMKDFDLSAMPSYVSEAIAAQKWAFACDYLRLYVLYHEGGIYLDSDVLMLEAPDSFLHHRFFSAIEYYEKLFDEGQKYVDTDGHALADMIKGLGIQAAILGSEPGHPFIAACLKHYEQRHFNSAELDSDEVMLAPHTLALAARDFGFIYRNCRQELEQGMALYPRDIFAPGMWECSENTVMIHLCSGSWRSKSDSFRRWWQKTLRKKIRRKRIKHFLYSLQRSMKIR